MTNHLWFGQIRVRSLKMMDWFVPPPKRPRRSGSLAEPQDPLYRTEEPQDLKGYEFNLQPIVHSGILPPALFKVLRYFEEEFMIEPTDDCSANLLDVLELIREGILALPTVKETWPRQNIYAFKGVPPEENDYSWLYEELLPIDTVITNEKLLLRLRV